jgi:hypothetical protein
MSATLTASEEAQLSQTIEMFEVITQSQPQDYQSLEILKEAYLQARPREGRGRHLQAHRPGLRPTRPAFLRHSRIRNHPPAPFPDDPDVQSALKEIESQANNLTGPTRSRSGHRQPRPKASPHHESKKAAGKAPQPDDGRRPPDDAKDFCGSQNHFGGRFRSVLDDARLNAPPDGSGRALHPGAGGQGHLAFGKKPQDPGRESPGWPTCRWKNTTWTWT